MQTIANSAHTIENSKVWRLGKKARGLRAQSLQDKLKQIFGE